MEMNMGYIIAPSCGMTFATALQEHDGHDGLSVLRSVIRLVSNDIRSGTPSFIQ